MPESRAILPPPCAVSCAAATPISAAQRLGPAAALSVTATQDGTARARERQALRHVTASVGDLVSESPPDARYPWVGISRSALAAGLPAPGVWGHGRACRGGACRGSQGGEGQHGPRDREPEE